MVDKYVEMQKIGNEYTDPLYGIYQIDEPFISRLNHPVIQKHIEISVQGQ